MALTTPARTGWVAPRSARWQRLNLRPLPHQHGSLAFGRRAGGVCVVITINATAAWAASGLHPFPVLPNRVVSRGPQHRGDLRRRALVGDLELWLGVARTGVPARFGVRSG